MNGADGMDGAEGTDGMEGTDGVDGMDGGGKNQGFMLVSDVHSSNVIGCGGELSQSE